MPLPQSGDMPPDVSLQTDSGETLKLADLKGHKAVLFFYPKADTSGCTQEAKDFSALAGDFQAADTRLLGISPDPVPAIHKFKAKYGLTVTLASDEARNVIEPWGLWVEKSLYGRTYMGVERTTVLLDAKGRVAKVWPKVKVAGHAEEVLSAAQTL